MLATLKDFFDSGRFMPHGHCFLWQPDILWLHVSSDAAVALAYFAIPFALLRFVRKKEDLPFKGLFLLFSAFILLCGATHLMSIWVLWHPDYGIEGIVKALTAVASIATLAVFCRLMPDALRLVSPTNGLLSAIVESSEDAIISRRPDGTVTSWNKGAELLFGYSAAEAIGQPYNFLFPPDLQEKEKEQLAHIRAGRHIEPAETVRVTKDGRRIHGLLSVSPIHNSAGEIIGSSRVFRDIAAHKEAQKSKALLSAIVESSEDAIIGKTLGGAISSWNSGAEKLFGYSAQEAIGRHICLIVPGERLEEEHDIDRQLRRGKRVEQADTIRLHKNGTNIQVALVASPIRDGQGRIIGASQVARDMRERREAEKAREQLRQAQKMESLGQLTGGIAHDFNNLLAIILGNMDLMIERTREDDPLRQHLTPAVEAAEHGVELTRQLLAFGRKQALQPQSIATNDLLHSFTRLVQHTLGERIEVILRLAPDAWNLRADPNLLQNALLNLAVNARDAMPEGGKLIFETLNMSFDEAYAETYSEVTQGDYVGIMVSDTGEGMSQTVMEKAFEPFFTTKEAGKGSGLGLSMVYGFVKQSAGHIKIYSEPGHGTSVKLYLPRAGSPPHGKADAKANPAAAGEPKQRILVVEDNKDVLKLTSTMVQELGYKVLQAENAFDALRLLVAHSDIALLLTDVMLSGPINGPELAKQAVAMHPDLKVLFNSGYAEHAMQQSGLLEEGVHLISKPFRKQQLAGKIKEALER